MKLPPIRSQLPTMYERLSRVFPDKPWLKIWGKYEEAMRSFSLRTGQMEVENWFVFALARWENEGTVDGNIEGDMIVQAILLANRIAEWCEALRGGLPGPQRLENRFRGALKNPADLRALHFELYIAEVLKSKGCAIRWQDGDNDEGTFDLLVAPPRGLPAFELECKSFAGDKGVAANFVAGQRLLDVCVKTANLFQYIPSRPGEANILSINVSRTIPTKDHDLEAVVEQFVAFLKGEADVVLHGFEIVRASVCVPTEPTDRDTCFSAADGLPGATLAFVSAEESGQGLRGLRIAWTGDFLLWEKAEDVAKEAIRHQLTRRRPAGLALQFMNDAAAPIVAASSPGNNFARLSKTLFAREQSLALVVFAGPIEVKPSWALPIPYRQDIFMAEFCRFATFVNHRPEYGYLKDTPLFS